MSQPRSPAALEYDLTAIDSSEFSKVIDECAQLKQQLQQTHLAELSMFKAAPDTTANAEPGSIVHDAFLIIDILTEKATKFRTQSDMPEPERRYFSEDEYRRFKQQYYDKRLLSLSVEDSGLPEERFFAACDLIETVLIRYIKFMKISSEAEKNYTMHCNICMSFFEIEVEHTTEFCKENNYNFAQMPAPVSRIPLTSAKTWLLDMIALIFSDWHTNKDYPNALIREFASPELRTAVGYMLTKVDRVLNALCGFYIDKDQALKSRYDEVITIRPNGIEDAKELLFKDNRARLELQKSTQRR